MKKTFLGAIFLAFAVVSCKKSTPVVPVNNNGISYMTMDTGSVWNYLINNNADTTSTTYTLFSTSNDTIINSKTYHVFSRVDTSGTSSEFYNISGDDYFQFTSLTTQLPRVELKYLQNNAPVGTTWEVPINLSQTQSGITLNFTATLLYTILDNAGSITVGNKSYSNVVSVKTEITNPSVTSSIPIPVTIEPIEQNIIGYYAPKQGMVKRDFQLKLDLNILGNVQNVINTNTSTSLVSSNIQ